jgi:hypothetical protein
MSEQEYVKYMEAQLENYAQVRARAFKSSIEDELAVARKQMKGLLKDGLKTRGHFIYVAVDSATGESVGNLWVHVEQDKKRAFLYNIIVHERFRKKRLRPRDAGLSGSNVATNACSDLGITCIR